MKYLFDSLSFEVICDTAVDSLILLQRTKLENVEKTWQLLRNRKEEWTCKPYGLGTTTGMNGYYSFAVLLSFFLVPGLCEEASCCADSNTHSPFGYQWAENENDSPSNP